MKKKLKLCISICLMLGICSSCNKTSETNSIDYTIYDTPGLIVNTDSLDNIKYKLIQNKPGYRLIIKDYILDIDSCIGLTLYINGKYKVITKKNNEVLNNTYNLNGYADIVLPGIGFIYVKNSTNIKSNKELIIRKSIIGGK